MGTPLLRRDGARDGDGIWVTGTIGDGATDERRSDDGKHELEAGKGQHRYRIGGTIAD